MSTHTNTQLAYQRDTLVAVVTNNTDLACFREDGWYRLPDCVLGRLLSKNVLEEMTTLAIYQTGAITDGLPSSIESWGEVAGIKSMYRRDLFPDESDHPAANQLYHKISISQAQYLDQPILSRYPRRVTFIRTKRERLLAASDVSDLIIGSHAEEKLCRELQAQNLDVERKVYMQVKDMVMEVDFGIFTESREIGLICSEREEELIESWNLLHFLPSQIESELEECVREIMKVVETIRASIG